MTAIDTSRPRVLIVNLMPDKQRTERQLAAMLSIPDGDVETVWAIPATHRARHALPAEVAARYRAWPSLVHQRFDAVVVTGAPVETLHFRDVDYWPELTCMFDWIDRQVPHSLFLCWSAQAALHHRHGVAKHGCGRKQFGVYPQRIVGQSDLLEGMGSHFATPVSRHSGVCAADIPAGADLKVLAGSPDTGLALIEEPSRGAIYLFNHPEYDGSSLADEYRRDRARGLAIDLPHNYFPGDDPEEEPTAFWHDDARRFFANWMKRVSRERPAIEPSRSA